MKGMNDPRRQRIFHGGSKNDISPFIQALLEQTPTQIFVRCVVLEFLHDPATLSQKKLASLRKKHKSKLEYITTAPNNTVIALPARTHGNQLMQPILLYPFFGSHHVLPIKPGEHVWAMFETDETREVGYWMSKIAEPSYVEDQNFTHADRRFSPSSAQSLKEKVGDSEPDDPTPGFPNGLGIPDTFSLPQDDGKNPYDTINEEADATKMHQFEPVPRYKKRPGDHTLEGSNNTLIVLGTDRSAAAADTDPDGNIIGYPEGDQLGEAGMIDIVAGRGQTPATAAPTIKNERGNEETDKRLDKASKTEGDPDFLNDLSRLYIAMKTTIDKIIEIEKGTAKLPNVDADSDEVSAAALLKSDQLRLIARKDIKIIVAPPGAAVDDANTSQLYASIVVKKDGTIVFAPAEASYIKLGGDHADRAILCTDSPAVASNGNVSAAPIETTMGGQVGDPSKPGLGTFSTKVLVVA